MAPPTRLGTIAGHVTPRRAAATTGGAQLRVEEYESFGLRVSGFAPTATALAPEEVAAVQAALARKTGVLVLDFGRLLPPAALVELTSHFGEPELSPGSAAILQENLEETTAEELRNVDGVAGEFGIDGEDEEELMGKYVVVIANPGSVPPHPATPTLQRAPTTTPQSTFLPQRRTDAQGADVAHRKPHASGCILPRVPAIIVRTGHELH